jgi:hypothetical protein
MVASTEAVRRSSGSAGVPALNLAVVPRDVAPGGPGSPRAPGSPRKEGMPASFSPRRFAPPAALAARQQIPNLQL